MALKTNSEKAIANIWDYIRNYTEDTFEEAKEWELEQGNEFNYDFSSNQDLASWIFDTFKSEKSYAVNAKYLYTHKTSLFDIFEEWASGLALGGLFCYYYNREAKEDLGNILEETEEEKARFNEQDAENYLTRIIFNQVTKNIKGGLLL